MAAAANTVGTSPNPRHVAGSPIKPPEVVDEVVDRAARLETDFTAAKSVDHRPEVNPVTAQSLSKSPSVAANPFAAQQHGSGSRAPSPVPVPAVPADPAMANPFDPGYLQIDPTATGNAADAEDAADTAEPAAAAPEPATAAAAVTAAVAASTALAPAAGGGGRGRGASAGAGAGGAADAAVVVAVVVAVAVALPALDGITQATFDKATHCEKTGDFGGAIEHLTEVLSDIMVRAWHAMGHRGGGGKKEQQGRAAALALARSADPSSLHSALHSSASAALPLRSTVCFPARSPHSRRPLRRVPGRSAVCPRAHVWAGLVLPAAGCPPGCSSPRCCPPPTPHPPTHTHVRTHTAVACRRRTA